MIDQKIGASHIGKEVAERRTGRWKLGMRELAGSVECKTS